MSLAVQIEKPGGGEKRILRYGDTVFEYTLFRRELGKKKVVLTVPPNGELVVTAAESIPLAQVEDVIRQRARWILETRETFAEQKRFAAAYRYVSGESHFYLGRKYQLAIVDDSQGREVKLKNGRFLVPSAFPWSEAEGIVCKRAEEVKRRLQAWYKEKAEIFLSKRLVELCQSVPWCDTPPSYTFRLMKKRWGSCSDNGSLMLNPLLVRASSECIDYVILHELCHLKVHNHSDEFWALLTQICPDWKKRKSKLDSMAEVWIGY